MKNNWKDIWNDHYARQILISGLISLTLLLGSLPIFFAFIEKRKGIQLDDRLLSAIPSHDLSIYIFLIIWGIGGLVLFRTIKSPIILMKFSWCYIFICLLRVLTILLLPLEPPKGIHELADPLTGIFYGHLVINKDLFFSGHTSVLYLAFMCLPRKTDKAIALTATIAVACMLLIQHVHYTVDIVTAPFFVHLVYVPVNKWLGRYVSKENH